MKAGKYYVGDLCYVMHDCWDEACALMFPKGHPPRGVEGELTLKDGRTFAVYGTAYGDGEYPDNTGNSYGVDAGIIGCILVDDIEEQDDNDVTLGTVHEFMHDFETSSDGSTITIGHVEVYTGNEEEGEEE